MLKMIKYWHRFMRTGRYKKYEARYQRTHSEIHQRANHRDRRYDATIGYQNAYRDYREQRQLKRFPLQLMRVINFILLHKIDELVNYMEGYQKALNELNRRK